MKSIVTGALALLLFPAVARAEKFESGPAAVPLLELFTSEGCSSCPPAEAWLGRLAADPGLWREFVPVAFHVNYWDHLGWKDELASRANTLRQHAYSAAWGAGGRVYTPGFVWAGREWRPGEAKPRPAVGQPGRLSVEWGAPGEVRVVLTPGEALARTGPLDVQVALLGAGLVSRVRAGENAGRELRHDFVVLGVETARLEPGPDGTLTARLPLDTSAGPAAPRRALAAWVGRADSPTPLQAVGGWLP